MEGLRIGAGPAAALAGSPEQAPEQDLGITVDLANADENGVITNEAPGTPDGSSVAASDPRLVGFKEQYPDAATVHLDGAGEPFAYETATGDWVGVVSGSAHLDDDGGLARDFGAGLGDVVEGAGDLVGLLSNPLNAGINAVAGTNLSTDMGQTFRDVSGLPDSERPIISAINKGGIAALGGAGIAQAARPVATGATNALLGQVAQQPVRQGVAGSSAAASAEGANQAGAPVPVQLLAGLGGGVAGFAGGQGAVNALAPRSTSALGRAARNQDVELLPADVGGSNTRRLTAAANQTPISATPITKAAQRSQEQFGDATKRASGGQVQFAEDAGEAIARGGQKFVKESRQKGSAL